MNPAIQTVAVEMPLVLFERLERIANTTHRTVEDVLSSTINVALPILPQAPAEVADELAAMQFFNDDALWAATHAMTSNEAEMRLQQLTDLSDQRTLSPSEQKESESLLTSSDRAIVRRAQAIAILTQRGRQMK